MAFSQFNAGNSIPNGWLSENQANVAQYNQDPKCGFIFTTNGFVNLLRLQKAAFEKRNWHVSNPHLPILVIAGEEDPVIRSRKRFEQLIAFLSELGYTNISSKLYEHMRHEILNEEKKLDVYKDILLFMMNSSIQLHIPMYKQDFGPAFFCDTSQKPGQTYPPCV